MEQVIYECRLHVPTEVLHNILELYVFLNMSNVGVLTINRITEVLEKPSLGNKGNNSFLQKTKSYLKTIFHYFYMKVI